MNGAMDMGVSQDGDWVWHAYGVRYVVMYYGTGIATFPGFVNYRDGLTGSC